MMLDCGKIKEIQVKLLLSSRSEMHKVIEAARQSVPILSLAPAPVVPTPAPAPTPTPQPVVSAAPTISPFSAALGANPLAAYGIPGIGNPQEIPQPAVIEPPAPLVSPQSKSPADEEGKEEDAAEKKRSKEKDRRRSRTRSRSRDRDRKDRKRDRRDRSRSRERRRRDRSRSRDKRDRKRDRKDRSRSRERSPRRSRDKRNERKSPQSSQERSLDNIGADNASVAPPPPTFAAPNGPRMPMVTNHMMPNGPPGQIDPPQPRFNDPTLAEAFNKLQELGKKRNPNAFQGEPQNGNSFRGARGGANPSTRGSSFRREGRPSRFDDQPRDCCVAIRNAPNHTSYGDVRRFFPFLIDKHGIKMINDNMGRRTGNIFVRFCDPRSKQLALQHKNNELKGAQVAVEDLDDDTYEAAVDSFLPYREDNDEDEGLVIADADEAAAKPFTVLKLTELSNFIQEHDIIKAFNEFSLLSITLTDCRMTRTKTAVVQFVKPEDAKLAFDRKDNYVFGRRKAVFTPVTDDEHGRDRQNRDQIEQPALLERPGIAQVPEQAMPRDPRQRRQQMDNGQAMQGGLAMQAPGQSQFFSPAAPFNQNFGAPFAAAQFGGYPGPGNMEPRAAAANWANRMNFPKQPDAGPNRGAMQVPMQAAPAMPQQVITVDLDDEPLDCVLMKGLPRDATDRTIVNFLADTGAVPARIHLMLDANGFPSGDCFCEFRSSQEARQAAGKHGKSLDGCRVTVDLVMRSVVEEALELPKSGERDRDVPQQYNNAPRGGFAPRGQFRGRGGFERGGYGGRGGFDSGRGRGRGGWSERGARGFERGRGRSFGRGRGGYGSDGAMPREDEPDPALEDFGAPGCVVSMENVPFRASVDEILGFFGDFDLTQDDVIRRYNERGQPTGDARVAFRTPFDAQRAVNTRNMDTIFDRRISLSIL